MYTVLADKPKPPRICYITLPDNVLTAKGLSTPFVSSCDQSDPLATTFVEAGILKADGSLFVYSPLVISANQSFVAPVVPEIAEGDVVGVWIGSNTRSILVTNK